MKDIKPNSRPIVGSVSLYDYNGLPHFALVVELAEDGFYEDGTNIPEGVHYHRFVKWTHPNLKGFWSPSG